MLCKEIIFALEQLAPKKLAESWDNVGLLVGREDAEVHKVMIALDATEAVVDQCVAEQVDLLITHHPILFSGIKQVNDKTATGRKLMKLLANKISCYALHTNFDVAVMAKEAARKLSLSHVRVLEPTYEETFYKLVVYVPIAHVDAVRAAFQKEDAGHIGNYSGCSFGAQGIGSFKPLDGTNPYIGTVNQMTYADEVRLETIVRPEKLDATIQSMLRAHPYEEVAYDVYQLSNPGEKKGIGCYGYLTRDMLLEHLVTLVKESFGVDSVSVAGNLSKRVANVAVCPGSGKSMVKAALQAKADVLITGDIDHHTALDALEAGLMIIDAGHYGTEQQFVDYIRGYITEYLYKADYSYVGLANELTLLAAKEESPFKVL